MTIEAVKLAADSNQWGAIFPELDLGVPRTWNARVGDLAAEKQHRAIPVVAGAGLAAVFVESPVEF